MHGMECQEDRQIMARKPTVDVVQVMQMLIDGQSTQSVADHFGVSRQAIDLHRRKFIQSGQLVERRAPRRALSSPGPAGAETKSRSAETLIKSGPFVSIPGPADAGTGVYQAVPRPDIARRGTRGSEAVSLDRLIELIIEAFDSLKQVPKLEAELEKYKSDYMKAAEQIEILEKAVSKRNEQEERWKQVMRSDMSQPPGSR